MTAERNQFERKLVEQSGRTLIESRCNHCGTILLGSVIFDDLVGQEQRHALQCKPDAGTQG
jgi:hypothetical protein